MEHHSDPEPEGDAKGDAHCHAQGGDTRRGTDRGTTCGRESDESVKRIEVHSYDGGQLRN